MISRFQRPPRLRALLVAAFVALASPSVMAGAAAGPQVVAQAPPTALPGTPPPPPTPLPGVGPVAQPPPPAAVPGTPAAFPRFSPTPTPPPNSALIRYSGQLLDYRAGYAYFTTGDAFRVASDVRIVNAASGAPTAEAPRVKDYARATFDPSGTIVELALSHSRLPAEASYEQIKGHAVALSPPSQNPDLVQRIPEGSLSGRPPTGKPVTVTFVVEVPPTTPISDSVYISTDASAWNPQAIRLDRIDALHYRVTRELASGTHFLYRYTRGTWQTEERGQNGLEPNPRVLTVREANALRRDDIVYNWEDMQAGFTQPGPQAIPTPFNPSPFAFPTPRATLPARAATPAPH